MKYRFAAALAAGIVLAQLNPTGSYNLGSPQTPGARVPESNPATAIIVPPSSPPGNPGAPAAEPNAAPSSAAPSGPAYSFGAAPPPVVSPGH